MAKTKRNRSKDTYAPPFTVSARAISMVADISALVERFAIRLEQPDALLLRRANKIRTIHSSLAIEGNTLSENQVSELLNGKRVVAPLRQIQEVKNAIATYDLIESLDPFSDGNGRMGRLWQSLILGRLHKAFLSLPVETIIHHNQQDYYNAINISSKKADCGTFIDFMLDEILQALRASQEQAEMSGGGVNGGVNAVAFFIEKHRGNRANAIAKALDLPLRSIQRYLSQLKSSGIVEFRGAPRKGGYYLIGKHS